MELDTGRRMVWSLTEMTGGPLPPYLLEIVMKDGRNFYVHSGGARNDDTNSVIINVWDLRAVDAGAELEIKKIIQNPKGWEAYREKQPADLHPALSVGKLKCILEDIRYVVEWWSREWDVEKFFPKESTHKMGFRTAR